MAQISDAFAEDIIDLIKNDTPHVALFDGDPEGAGTEFTGSGYAREELTLGAVSSGSASNTGELRWTGLDSGEVTHVAIYDASSSGNRLMSGATQSASEVDQGDEYFISAGNFTVTASGA